MDLGVRGIFVNLTPKAKEVLGDTTAWWSPDGKDNEGKGGQVHGDGRRPDLVVLQS